MINEIRTYYIFTIGDLVGLNNLDILQNYNNIIDYLLNNIQAKQLNSIIRDNINYKNKEKKHMHNTFRSICLWRFCYKVNKIRDILLEHNKKQTNLSIIIVKNLNFFTNNINILTFYNKIEIIYNFGVIFGIIKKIYNNYIYDIFLNDIYFICYKDKYLISTENYIKDQICYYIENLLFDKTDNKYVKNKLLALFNTKLIETYNKCGISYY